MSIIGPEGAVVYHGIGERDAVFAPREAFRGDIVVHNHPSGGSLSRRDVRLLPVNKVAQMRGVTDEWTYILDLPDDTEWEDVEDLVTILVDQVDDRHRELLLTGELSYREAEARRWHEIWQGIAEIRGWTYSRQPRTIW